MSINKGPKAIGPEKGDADILMVALYVRVPFSDSAVCEPCPSFGIFRFTETILMKIL
jgi:hypothetical protein